jgi:hypothetical protein
MSIPTLRLRIFQDQRRRGARCRPIRKQYEMLGLTDQFALKSATFLELLFEVAWKIRKNSPAAVLRSLHRL